MIRRIGGYIMMFVLLACAVVALFSPIVRYFFYAM